MEASDLHPWNKIYFKIVNLKSRGLIIDENHLENIIRTLERSDEYEDISEDDIQDAAWAAWSDTK